MIRMNSLLIASFALLLAAACFAADRPCRIQIVEKGTGWPVPLVELRTTHQVRLVSDNAGLIACDLPELMGRETWFTVIGHGYEVAKDGFGYRGVRLTPEMGKTLKVEVTRTIVAKRLGRLTGAGLFAESQKLEGLPQVQSDAVPAVSGGVPGGRDARAPRGVFGCDSVLTAVHDGKMFWAWGDTTLPGYPLGIFDTSSATTPLQPLKSFEPPLHIEFNYFVD